MKKSVIASIFLRYPFPTVVTLASHARSKTSDALIVTLSTINFSPARTRAYLHESTRQTSELREKKRDREKELGAWMRGRKCEKKWKWNNAIKMLSHVRRAVAGSDQARVLSRATRAVVLPFLCFPVTENSWKRSTAAAAGVTRELEDALCNSEMRESLRVMLRGGKGDE